MRSIRERVGHVNFSNGVQERDLPGTADGAAEAERGNHTGARSNVADYTIESVESQPFAQISYIVWRNGRHDAVVIDPGFDTAVDPGAARRITDCASPRS